ncbi:hypothetical protein SAMN02910356_00337 [Selenomonas sp. GACV-9]|uniref:hypothetical protein n=1 Tax=Selenomonas sp. GACV-9 TaxID=3158782 RepID=UPI0008F0F1C3|nr:hypothetical protein SAMN02910356_00337 [Selenomonas ruminantium]
MNIAYDSLRVKGIPCRRILDLELYHAPNMIGTVKLMGETSQQEIEHFIPRAGKDLVRLIVSGAAGEEQTIFCGYLDFLDYELCSQYATVTCTLKDTACLLDLRREDQTYQDLAKTYQDVLRRSYALAGVETNLTFGVPDKPIGRFLAQMQETAWEYSVRLASHFHTAVFTRLREEKPSLSVGLPAGTGQKIMLDSATAAYRQDNRAYLRYRLNQGQVGEKTAVQDFGHIICASDEYACLGDTAAFGGKDYVITRVQGMLQDGLLRMSYELSDPQGLRWPLRQHPSCGGRISKGKVQAVERDRIQVWFDGMDAMYDSGSSTWFPYSTGYSSADGSGWYVMPEPQDEVRILFPSHNEAAAFGASAVNQAPAPAERNKYFRAPGGNNVLMDEDGITLDCTSADSFIRISQSKGVQVYSTRPIVVSSQNDIEIEGKEGVVVQADDSITMQVGNSNIHMDAQEIGMGANVIKIGQEPQPELWSAK